MIYTHWIEIDCDALIHNLTIVRENLRPGVKLMAVVKADAYGLGSAFIARLFEEFGVDMLGVTHLEEGISLRQEGIKLPILLFSPLQPQEAASIVKYNLTPTITSKVALEALGEKISMENKFPIHLKVETGMGRTGISIGQVLPFCRQIKDNFPQIKIEGIYSHFAQAARGDAFTENQLAKFLGVLDELAQKDYQIPLRHIANSIAAFDLPNTQLDLVRIGTVLYGQYPLKMKNRPPLKDPWQAKAKILQVQNLPAGASIGYGREYILKKDSRIGILPIGFADGLGLSPIGRPKSLLDLAKVLVKQVLAYLNKGPGVLAATYFGKKFFFVGRLGMQFSMIDLEDSPLTAGDVVEVPLGRISASANLPRIYLKEKEIIEEKIVFEKEKIPLPQRGEGK